MIKRFFIIALLFILSSCASILLNPDAKQEFQRGLLLFNQGEYEQALPYFQRATEIEPNYTKAYIYTGRSHLNLGKWADAIPPLRTAYRQSPDKTKKEAVNFLLDALIGGALEALKNGNFETSINFLHEALDLDPEGSRVKTVLIQAFLAYGSNLLSEGRLTDAISQFTEAVQLSPQNLDAYLGLAKAFLGQGNFFEAMKIIRKAMGFASSEADRSMFRELLDE